MKKLNLHIFYEKTGKSKTRRISPIRPLLWIFGAIVAAVGFALFSPFEIAHKLSDGTLIGLRTQNRDIRANLEKLRTDNDSAEHYIARTEAFQDSVYKIGGIPIQTERDDSTQRKERTEALFQTYKTYSVFRDTLLSNPGRAEAIPVLHPLKRHHVITNRFGMLFDHFTDQNLPHRGVDFFADEGDTVIATGAGTVIEVRTHRGFGLSIKIQHTENVRTFYAHLEKNLVKQGERVKRGDPIATVGRSGRTAGSGLHYEIRIDGEPVNPEDYFIVP